MTFAQPGFLFLLAVALGLAARTLWRPATAVMVPFDHAQARPLRVGRFLRTGAGLLPALLLAVMIVLMAGPRRTVLGPEEQLVTNVEICLDISGSMTDPFILDRRTAPALRYGVRPGEPRRFAVALRAIEKFAKGRPGDAFGLTVFGDDVVSWLPLSQDRDALARAALFVDPVQFPSWFVNNTRIAKAVESAADTLAVRRGEDNILLLVTDGEDDELTPAVVDRLVDKLCTHRIAVFVVYLGHLPAPPQEIALAQRTTGQLFVANDETGVAAVLKRIHEMKPLQYRQVLPTEVDNYGPFAIAGLAVLASYTVSLVRWRYTPW
jgi:Ca-activated chloride channel family protein